MPHKRRTINGPLEQVLHPRIPVASLTLASDASSCETFPNNYTFTSRDILPRGLNSLLLLHEIASWMSSERSDWQRRTEVGQLERENDIR